MALTGLGLWDFEKELNKFIEEDIPKAWKRQQIEIICFMYQEISDHTPVAKDERRVKGGHAQSNWRVSKNPKSNVLGSRERPSKRITTQEIRTYLHGIAQGTSSKQGFADIVWIYNNVHYIQALEDGYSDQAPTGMVHNAILRTKEFIASKLGSWKLPEDVVSNIKTWGV